MRCSACGKDNPNDANYCTFCGKSLGSSSNVEQKKDSTSWEYCQIQSSWKHTIAMSNKYECFFWADALGRNGAYCAAKTEKYILQQKWKWEAPATPPYGNKDEDREKSSRFLNELIRTLQKDGWEKLPERGPNSWSYQFKRREK
jgi:hypothetical protein